MLAKDGMHSSWMVSSTPGYYARDSQRKWTVDIDGLTSLAWHVLHRKRWRPRLGLTRQTFGPVWSTCGPTTHQSYVEPCSCRAMIRMYVSGNMLRQARSCTHILLLCRVIAWQDNLQGCRRDMGTTFDSQALDFSPFRCSSSVP